MLKFKAMRHEEVSKNSRGPVQFLSAFSRHRTLDESSMFGDIKGRANLEHESEINVTFENYRRHIPLRWPVINYITSNNGILLRMLLNMGKRNFDNLRSFTEVLDISGPFPVNIRDYKDKTVDEVLMGAEALQYLSGFVDYEDIITQELEKISPLIMSNLGHKTSSNTIFNYIDSDKDPSVRGSKSSFHVIGRFYLEVSDLVHQYGITQDVVYQSVMETIKDGFGALTFLINIRDKEHYKELVDSMFLRDVMVMPEGLRPGTNNLVHQFTNQYKKIIREVDDARRLDEYTIEEKRNAYMKMEKAVYTFIYSDKGERQKGSPTVSIVESLKSKYGFIRNKMLGKRVDYSGRSVITINSELSIDEAGIPKEMIVKLYRPHHVKAVRGLKSYTDVMNMPVDEALAEIINLGLLEEVPVMLNRAPSLHRLSLLGFKVKVSRSQSIELSALVTTGFNADFDGDQMGVHIPLSDKAIAEVNKLMLPSKNIFHPATGKSIIQPKMEMIYGLNIATRPAPNKESKTYTFSTIEEVYNALINHDIKVWDKVNIQGYSNAHAGRIGLIHCLPKKLHDIEDVITSKTISKYTSALIERYPSDSQTFVKTTDALVSYGFKMSKIYSPTISVLDEKYADPTIRDPIFEFYEEVKEVTKLYNRGLEDEETYENIYASMLKKASDKTRDIIPEMLGEDNGFLQLVNAGARGSIDNLRQIYAYKGQIQRSDVESFSAVIESNFSEQLNPLEHFISAYGTRKGLIDKTQKTGDTGYSERLMYQAAADWVITNYDCGTTDGLEVDKNFISTFIKTDKPEEKKKEVSEFFKSIIEGRYDVETDEMISASRADKLAFDDNVVSIVIRSPLRCKVPCCTKCYGTDLGTMKPIVLGQPVGILAGHAIGEPGTQLVMRTFQKGGVAGKADVTSNFDRMKRFLKISNMSQVSTYDPIAWATGPVIVTPINDYKKSIRIGDSKKSIEIPIRAFLKEEVVKGEGICQIQGEHDIQELIKYAGFHKAQTYLYLAMSTCYLGVADINSVHFEVLVASMCVHLLVDAGESNLKPGLLYTSHRISENRYRNIKYLSTIRSVHALPLLKDSPLNRILMENFVKGTSSSVLLGLEDKFDNQMVRLMMGMRPQLGTAYSGYLENGRG